MTAHWVYYTNPATDTDDSETVHIVDFEHSCITPVNLLTTVCGVRVGLNWREGDETNSGVAATCGRCAKIRMKVWTRGSVTHRG